MTETSTRLTSAVAEPPFSKRLFRSDGRSTGPDHRRGTQPWRRRGPNAEPTHSCPQQRGLSTNNLLCSLGQPNPQHPRSPSVFTGGNRPPPDRSLKAEPCQLVPDAARFRADPRFHLGRVLLHLWLDVIRPVRGEHKPGPAAELAGSGVDQLVLVLHSYREGLCGHRFQCNTGSPDMVSA